MGERPSSSPSAMVCRSQGGAKGRYHCEQWFARKEIIMSVLDFDELERQLDSGLSEREVSIHFLGAQGEDTDVSFQVPVGFFADAVTLLTRAHEWLLAHADENEDGVYGVSLSEVGIEEGLRMSNIDLFNVNIETYTYLLGETMVHRVRV
jgi:hypothetical protein